MYVAIDIGGSKTLVAAFNSDGQIARQQKFPTSADYPTFLEDLKTAYTSLEVSSPLAAAVAVPGRLDRQHGVVIACGNLPWRNLPIQKDVSKITGTAVIIENDAKLAALSEGRHIMHDYNKVLYITISTGIGTGVTINGKIDTSLIDMEGGRLLAMHDGKLVSWESFASGKAIKQRFGKLASEIPLGSPIWEEIVSDWAPNIYNLLALVVPDAVVIGGGVGHHLPRFRSLLTKALKTYATPLVPIPPILSAHHAEQAVIYGCYLLAREI